MTSVDSARPASVRQPWTVRALPFVLAVAAVELVLIMVDAVYDLSRFRELFQDSDTLNAIGATLLEWVRLYGSVIGGAVAVVLLALGLWRLLQGSRLWRIALVVVNALLIGLAVVQPRNTHRNPADLGIVHDDRVPGWVRQIDSLWPVLLVAALAAIVLLLLPATSRYLDQRSARQG